MEQLQKNLNTGNISETLINCLPVQRCYLYSGLGANALANTRKKRVVGYARMVDSFEMSVEELKKHNSKHRANDFLDM